MNWTTQRKANNDITKQGHNVRGKRKKGSPKNTSKNINMHEEHNEKGLDRHQK